ncbi:leucyl/phenylalanyl-tRNA--protein transferase [Allosphingosinicella flava]|uniref:Leucyl/phenylalanyl-tRNA--protein transferase n=1 Tax=Allosphingosinicella flava TaxID=2771430 RepID=A0A7T2GJT2_9SPHN|nr:leucyl/phenylalanyl-tRNA--protein transferase [Sphingosinicella flava]QPQ55174.1 leucyl/phenylalanyl-tRNA--protein transferase [Sphingosinicella flava]
MSLTPDLLLRAYAIGVFPMADSRDASEVYWVEPKKRAIIPLDTFRLSHSLRKTVRGGRFAVTSDAAFTDVVRLCAAREETWINPEIEESYAALFQAGHAHSIECWDDGALVGGLYGVSLGRAFFGESMFSLRTDASKVALAWLVARLKAGGFTLLDCQFMTDHLRSLGAVEISQKDYIGLLSAALSEGSEGGDVAGTGEGAASSGADFGALDRLLEEASRDGAAVPAGWVIAQLLGHTS